MGREKEKGGGGESEVTRTPHQTCASPTEGGGEGGRTLSGSESPDQISRSEWKKFEKESFIHKEPEVTDFCKCS